MGNDDRWETEPRTADETPTTTGDTTTDSDTAGATKDATTAGQDTSKAAQDTSKAAQDTTTAAGDDAGLPGASNATPSDEDGFGRREFVATGALAAAAAGGWYVFVREDEETGPLAAIEATWTYWENGNADAYRALYHSESPEREESYWSDDSYWAEFGMEEDVEWEILERSFVERSETEAVVEEVYYWNTPDQEPQHITDRVHLRVEDGDWKLWRIEYVSSEPAES